jgi:hypothetical protein
MSLDIEATLNELKAKNAEIQSLIKNMRNGVRNDEDAESTEPVAEEVPAGDEEVVEETIETTEQVDEPSETAAIGDTVVVQPDDPNESPVEGEIITIVEESEVPKEPVAAEPAAVEDMPVVANARLYRHIKNSRIINGKAYAPIAAPKKTVVQNVRPRRMVVNGVTYQEVTPYNPETYAEISTPKIPNTTIKNTRKVIKRVIRNVRPTVKNVEIDPNTKVGK